MQWGYKLSTSQINTYEYWFPLNISFPSTIFCVALTEESDSISVPDAVNISEMQLNQIKIYRNMGISYKTSFIAMGI